MVNMPKYLYVFRILCHVTADLHESTNLGHHPAPFHQLSASMATTPPQSGLVAISDNTLFVLGAYFFAFFPWGVISNVDFISEKWRTVRRTRQLSRIHLVLSVLPITYVAVYAEAQRQAGDSKELGAALAALFFNIFNFLRTVVGIVQLNAFVAWCVDAMKCMRAMKEPSDDGEGSVCAIGNTDDINSYISERLMVNNSVVDNELAGTDVTVKVSWRKLLEGVKNWQFDPSAWLISEHALLSTVRWGGAFLCGLGDDWCGGKDYIGLGTETLSCFFSSDYHIALRTLQNVTINVYEEESDHEGEDEKDVEEKGGEEEVNIENETGANDEQNGCPIFSVTELYPTAVQYDPSGNTLNGATAYGTGVFSYNLWRTFNSYELEFEGLRTSFPYCISNARVENRENICVELIDSVVMAKHIGSEKLALMRNYYDQACLPTSEIWKDAWLLLLEQCQSLPPEDSQLFKMYQDMEHVPLFPYRLQMVALWDEFTNWRVLQASVHRDIHASVFAGDALAGRIRDVESEKSLYEMDLPPRRIFSYCREMGRRYARSEHSYSQLVSFGVVMETVRSFLAEWLVSNAQAPQWDPIIPGTIIELSVSEYSSRQLRDPDAWGRNRLIWECLRGLHSSIVQATTAHTDMPSCDALIMLFILGLPALDIQEVSEFSISGDEMRSGTERSAIGFSGSQVQVDVSVGCLRISSQLTPQKVALYIQVDEKTQLVSLKLVSESDDARFIWEDWINAAMGFMEGCDESRTNKVENKRIFREVDLRKSMLELSPFHVENIEGSNPTTTGTVRVWMGWPAYDVRICKFELDEWLTACKIDLANLARLDVYGNNAVANREVERAENAIMAIVSRFE